MKTLPLFCFFLLIGFTGNAQQLTYKPVNPAFGGNYLNYSWLLQSANAQNPFDDQDTSYGQGSVIDQFSDTVKRQILSQLTRDLMGGSGTGTGTGEAGTIEVGGLIITVDETRTGSIITIIDTDTGESTEIIL